MRALYALLVLGFYGLSFLSFLFLVRLLVALFYRKAFDQMRQHPRLHLLWGLSAACYFGLVYVLSSGMWPPHWVELRQQRAKALERVKAAGGWEVIQNECGSLVRTNPEQPFIWQFGPTNALPPALQVLGPQQVLFEPHDPNSKEGLIVQIKMFGMHSSGGHSKPYYGFEIVCNTNSTDYQPQAKTAVSGNSHHHYRRITPTVFEVY